MLCVEEAVRAKHGHAPRPGVHPRDKANVKRIPSLPSQLTALIRILIASAFSVGAWTQYFTCRTIFSLWPVGTLPPPSHNLSPHPSGRRYIERLLSYVTSSARPCERPRTLDYGCCVRDCRNVVDRWVGTWMYLELGTLSAKAPSVTVRAGFMIAPTQSSLLVRA